MAKLRINGTAGNDQLSSSYFGGVIMNGLRGNDVLTGTSARDYIYGYASEGGEVAEKAAITGALSLYLNFINLFTLLLQLLGQRE